MQNIKKNLYIISSLLFLIALSLHSTTPDNTNNINSSGTIRFTPIRFSFFPDVWSWPDNMDIYGLNLGLVNNNDEKYSSHEYIVAGLDAAWFISFSNNVYGIQFSNLNKTKYSAGLQLGVLNMQDKSAGMQLGLINLTEESSSFQMGLYNSGDSKAGIFQFGLINVLDNGFFSFFPIINFTTK